MNHQAEMMQESLQLTPFMEQIQRNEISEKQTAIIYSILQHTSEICIHRQNGAIDNQVFIHKDGHFEAVFDKHNKPVKDGVNDASFNYFHPFNKPLYHFTFDISPWIMWGQSATDNTTAASRIIAYTCDLKAGIRLALKEKQYIERQWSSDGQVQALAVFLRAINAGKAEALFDLFKSGTEVKEEQLDSILAALKTGFERIYMAETPH
ncbi:hypothetical protein DSLASN_06290 [Desulfoluna limicola]|uniref:Uncharacterized protein n=1 Tax=Desulfoluna limicola TaxID=2810562 RepID=A0ABN6F0J9_9BACT|nr:hypothetical protein [Desulfoluna limicola]BCS94997.1 hypothetical protein DSLASN_06290 [Desulfoluna limicola]